MNLTEFHECFVCLCSNDFQMLNVICLYYVFALCSVKVLQNMHYYRHHAGKMAKHPLDAKLSMMLDANPLAPVLIF